MKTKDELNLESALKVLKTVDSICEEGKKDVKLVLEALCGREIKKKAERVGLGTKVVIQGVRHVLARINGRQARLIDIESGCWWSDEIHLNENGSCSIYDLRENGSDLDGIPCIIEGVDE